MNIIYLKIIRMARHKKYSIAISILAGPTRELFSIILVGGVIYIINSNFV
jgi:hypothetical protein